MNANSFVIRPEAGRGRRQWKSSHESSDPKFPGNSPFSRNGSENKQKWPMMISEQQNSTAKPLSPSV